MIMKNWVYVIFAKDNKEYTRTIEELQRHHGVPTTLSSQFFVHAEDQMHILVLVNRLNEQIVKGGNKSYKNHLAIVYPPSAVALKMAEVKEHADMHNLHRQHLPPEDYKIISIDGFIKTNEEVEEEARQKKKSREEWFANRMRTVTNV